MLTLGRANAMIRRPLRPARPVVTVIAVAITASLASCGGTPLNPFDPPPPPARDDVGGRAFANEISNQEIRRRGNVDPSAFELIKRLRPNWLVPRGQNSFSADNVAYPVVYLDAVRHGNVSALRHITPGEIQRVEFIGTADATTRWGTGHRAGVINIVTGR